MEHKIFNRSKKVGLPPGSLVYLGEDEAKKVNIEVIDYNETSIEIKELSVIEGDISELDKNKIRWINIEGLQNIDIIKQIGTQFKIHPLILEDIVSTEQRPKLENHDNIIAVFLNLLFWNKDKLKLKKYQTTIILGSNFVITFENKERKVFNPIRERLKTSRGIIRQMKADYLLYTLIDVIIDNYFIVVERFNGFLEELEEELELEPSNDLFLKINNLKREIIIYRKFIKPLKELINNLIKKDITLIQEDTRIYFKDIGDHIVQISETFDGFRDILSGMKENYQSFMSEKMNHIINVLTIVTTIFIPLSFLTGLYGMNFAFIPELQNPYGYFVLLGVMVSLSTLLLIFFKKKKWI